jgi:hypothetical protein
VQLDFPRSRDSAYHARRGSMHSVDILYPMFALVLLTFSVLIQIPIRRFRAAYRGQVTVEDFRLGESANVPMTTSLPNRNYMNLLELPVLFYVLCLGLYVTGRADSTSCLLAWIYVGLRVVHSAIHVTYNHVIQRLVVFATSNFLLAGCWIRFFLQL